MPSRSESREYRIFLFPSFACNNRCIHCFNDSQRRKYTRSLDQLLAFIDTWSEKYSALTIGGGEPTIYPHLPELLAHAQRRRLKVTLFSNCRRFIDKGFAEKITAYDMDRVIVTIHSPSPQIHDHITRIPGSLSQTLAGIANLQQTQLKTIQLQIIIHRLNYRHLLELAKLAHTLGIGHISFSSLIYQGEAMKHKNELKISLRETIPYLLEACDYLLCRGMKFAIYAYPLCLIPHPYWSYVPNMRPKKEVMNYHLSLGTADLASEKSLGMAIGPSCAGCLGERLCPGTWETYYDLFGEAEFSKNRLAKNLKNYLKSLTPD